MTKPRNDFEQWERELYEVLDRQPDDCLGYVVVLMDGRDYVTSVKGRLDHIAGAVIKLADGLKSGRWEKSDDD